MTPRRLFATYLWIAGLYSLAASLVWGVNTLFLLDAGLDILQVFVAGAVYTAGIVLLEIPTGVIADARGRRLSFLLSIAALFVGTLVYVGAARYDGGLPVFCFGAGILALGATCYSGAVEAWLVDGLDSSGHRGPLDPLLARGQVVTSVTTLVGTVAGGLLATLDLAYPYLLRAALLVPLAAFAALEMRDLGFTPLAARRSRPFALMRRMARAGAIYGWRQPAVRALLVLGILHYGFLAWAFHAWQPYFLELLGEDAPWVAGVVAALITLATLAGNSLAGWILPASRRRTTVLLWAAAALSASAIVTGLAGTFPLAVAALLTASGAWGVVGPIKQAFLHREVRSEQRATILSLDSLLSNLGGVGGQTALGYQARLSGIASGYFVGGLATVLALPVLWALRRLDDRQDRVRTL